MKNILRFIIKKNSTSSILNNTAKNNYKLDLK